MSTGYQPREGRGERSEGGRGEGRGGFGGGAGAGGAAGGRKVFFRRRKSCPLSGPNAPTVDYKDVKLLGRFISERGKILPSRITRRFGERSSARSAKPSSARATSRCCPTSYNPRSNSHRLAVFAAMHIKEFIWTSSC